MICSLLLILLLISRLFLESQCHCLNVKALNCESSRQITWVRFVEYPQIRSRLYNIREIDLGSNAMLDYEGIRLDRGRGKEQYQGTL